MGIPGGLRALLATGVVSGVQLEAVQLRPTPMIR